MPIDLASASAEDLKPVADLMLTLPPEKRGEVTLRVQRAARDFLAKSLDEQRGAAGRETDPVRRAVFGALAKQLPEPEKPAPTLDPLKREALGTLVKAVTAGAKAGLGKGIVGSVLGAAGKVGAHVGANLGAKVATRTKQPAARAMRTVFRGARIGRGAAQAGVVVGAAIGAASGAKAVFGRKKKKQEA